MVSDEQTGRRDELTSGDDAASEPAAEALEALEIDEADRRALLERLTSDERVRYALRGRLMDYESDDSDRERREESRTRKMASRGRDLLTIVTARRLLIVVQRATPADHEYRSIPYDKLESATLETVTGNRRLVIRGAKRYYVDVGRSPADVATAACSYVRRRIDARPADDPLETIERLATLFDQGLLTRREFEEKKRELLDRI